MSSIWSKSRRWLIVTIRPRFLKANATICVAGTFRICAELADGDELVDANELLLDLGLGRAHGLDLLARPVVDAYRGAAAPGPPSWRMVLRDVRRHGFLVDLPALALLAAAGCDGDARARSTGTGTGTAPAPACHHHRRRRRRTVVATGAVRRSTTRRRGRDGRGGNATPLVTGRGRGAPGMIERGRGRSGVEYGPAVRGAACWRGAHSAQPAHRARPTAACTSGPAAAARCRRRRAVAAGEQHRGTAAAGARRAARFGGGSRGFRPAGLPHCARPPIRRAAAAASAALALGEFGRRVGCGRARRPLRSVCRRPATSAALRRRRRARTAQRLAAGTGAGSGTTRRGDGALAAPARGLRGARTLLALPPSADARDLVVGELLRWLRTANIQRPKHRDDFVARNAELRRQISGPEACSNHPPR